MAFESICYRCGRAISDRDSVRTYDNKLLCYICARIERDNYNRYYDDDKREFDEEDSSYPWSW